MTSSDAPQPPGGPLRQDEPDGPLQPAETDRDRLADRPSEPGDDGDAPAVTGGPTQSQGAAELQEENAASSLDQPSQ